ncbi:MAG: L-threonylcarbamoyladenylate synthase [Bacteroidota bacterium]
MAEIGKDIIKAKSILHQDDVIGLPTETVYGLAGNALSEKAILKIYNVKNRPKFDPLIAHTDSLEKVKDLVNEIPDSAIDLAKTFWPGPLTLLLHKNDSVPDLLTSGLSRVAIRIPQHPLTLGLLQSIDYPLAAPSANPFGYVSPTKAKHVEDQLGDRVSYILDGGKCQIGLESTIVGFEDDEPVIYRLGGTKVEAIKEVIGKVNINVNVSSNPAAPGMLKSHYSPGRKMILGNINENLKSLDPNTTGIISFTEKYEVPKKNQIILSVSGDIDEAARNIFSALRKMDQPHIRVILSEYLPKEGLGRAINDRLRRAAV